MNQKLNQYVEILSQQNRVLRGLLELTREKKQYIILGEVRELDGLLKKEAGLVMSLEALEERRFHSQGELIHLLGAAGEESGASRLLEMVREKGFSGAEALQEQLEEMQAAVNMLKLLNRENEDLINQSLAFIQSLEEAVTRGGASTYSREGTMVDSKSKLTILDRKV
jgi:flagellar biosynthesis/type III secretory pathway chaperone